jgi:hypothetical protein
LAFAATTDWVHPLVCNVRGCLDGRVDGRFGVGFASMKKKSRLTR